MYSLGSGPLGSGPTGPGSGLFRDAEFSSIFCDEYGTNHQQKEFYPLYNLNVILKYFSIKEVF